MDSKLGRFSITSELIRRSPEVVKMLMGDMIILRAEHLFVNDVIEYTASSDLFEELPKGVKIPEYNIVTNKKDGESGIEYTFTADMI